MAEGGAHAGPTPESQGGAAELVRQLLLSWERLDLGWRRRLSLDANEKCSVVCLAAHGALTPRELGHRVGLGEEELGPVVESLRRRGYVRMAEGWQRGSLPGLLTFTKRGLRMRIEVESVMADLAWEIAALDAPEREVVERFVTTTCRVFAEHGEDLSRRELGAEPLRRAPRPH